MSPALRWSILGLLLGVVVAALVVAGVTVVRHDGELSFTSHSAPNEALDREQALGVAKDFVTRFNTYGPQLLAEDGTMPQYSSLTDEMSAKFGGVFSKYADIAVQTVKRLKVRRSAIVYGWGVSALDADTATAIVAGVARFQYPDRKHQGKWLNFDPEQFRYTVSLVKQHGRWLVDDMDDVDDGLPSFANSNGEPTGGQVPSSPPSLSGPSTGGGDK